VEQWRKILHPTDFSEVSEAAFVSAVTLGREHDAELVLLHILTTSSPYEIEAVGWRDLYEADEADRRRAARAELAVLVGRVERSGVRGATLLADGVPHREIVRIAASIHADLIVMGTHGRSGLDHLLLGSTAARVIRAADCPVLTMRVSPPSVARPRLAERILAAYSQLSHPHPVATRSRRTPS
jgi:nucleotide-binding universal stress UspA family protein